MKGAETDQQNSLGERNQVMLGYLTPVYRGGTKKEKGRFS